MKGVRPLLEVKIRTRYLLVAQKIARSRGEWDDVRADILYDYTTSSRKFKLNNLTRKDDVLF